MADVVNSASPRAVADQPTADLVHRATEQVSRLIRDELALARTELAEKGRHAGLGIGLFGGGGVFALLGVGTLVATAVLALDVALPAWLAALIVAVALFVVAGVLALVGKRQVSQAKPPVPSATAESVRADVNAVTTAVRDRGRS